MEANDFYSPRRAMRPKPSTWARHALLLVLTLCTATVAGVLYPFGSIAAFPNVPVETWSEAWQFLYHFPVYYFQIIAVTIGKLATEPEILKNGLSFSVSLLF